MRHKELETEREGERERIRGPRMIDKIDNHRSSRAGSTLLQPVQEKDLKMIGKQQIREKKNKQGKVKVIRAKQFDSLLLNETSK